MRWGYRFLYISRFYDNTKLLPSPIANVICRDVEIVGDTIPCEQHPYWINPLGLLVIQNETDDKTYVRLLYKYPLRSFKMAKSIATSMQLTLRATKGY